MPQQPQNETGQNKPQRPIQVNQPKRQESTNPQKEATPSHPVRKNEETKASPDSTQKQNQRRQ